MALGKRRSECSDALQSLCLVEGVSFEVPMNVSIMEDEVKASPRYFRSIIKISINVFVIEDEEKSSPRGFSVTTGSCDQHRQSPI